VDGTVNVAPIHEGSCPLSPLLFALFINDFNTERGININVPGPQGSSSNIISNIFYADDLLLTATKRESLQNSLLLFSNSEGLKVDTSKSKLVIFNSRSEEQPLKYMEIF
jgi:hypothetical protein